MSAASVETLWESEDWQWSPDHYIMQFFRIVNMIYLTNKSWIMFASSVG